jgi:hypothetical protein
VSSLLDDPSIYMRLYELTAKIREILRTQTFGPPEVQQPEADSLREQYAAERKQLIAALSERFCRE